MNYYIYDVAPRLGGGTNVHVSVGVTPTATRIAVVPNAVPVRGENPCRKHCRCRTTHRHGPSLPSVTNPIHRLELRMASLNRTACFIESSTPLAMPSPSTSLGSNP